MAEGSVHDSQLEIAHVLFLDIVGYSKLLVNQQTELLKLLTEIVRSTEQFRTAEAADKLVRLPTGDGMALAFFTSPDAPIRCAREIDRRLKDHPQLNVRMGVHSGPVDVVRDVNDRVNVAGAGINLAQRVMDCGDAGHILLSKRVADDLGQYEHWQPHLYDLGRYEVKHGIEVEVVNFFDGEAGTPELPEKFKRKHETHVLESRAAAQRKRRKLLAYISLSILLVALGVAFAFRARPTAATTTNSIAILPFKPLVRETSDQVLEFGMADSLITKLSSGSGIIVPSLSSVRQFAETDPVTAGRKLGVQSVLEGNVQRAGDNLRVTVRLIKVDDGSSIWSNSFDEKFTDVFAMQDTISQKVIEALSLRLNANAQQRLKKRYTENVAAYQLFMTGRFHWNKFTPPDQRKSIDYFEQAVQIDPGYALAYFGIGDAYRALGMTGNGPATEFFPKAEAAFAKALAIDDSLAEVHAALAVVKVFYDWDWPTAEHEAKRAIALDENSGNAHLALAQVLASLGRHDEAMRQATRGRELDPVSPLTNSRTAGFFYTARRYDEVFVPLQRALEVDPDFWIAHYFFGKSYIELGKTNEALAALDKAIETSHHNPEPIAIRAYLFGRAGDKAQAQATLAQLQQLATQRYVSPYHMAVAHLGAGDVEGAMEFLEKGFAEREPRMSWLKVEPVWDSVRANAKFRDLLVRLKLS